MQQQSYDQVKQHILDQLKILNARAYHFYIQNRHLKAFQIRNLLWNSELWHEAKALFKELNEHLYGKLTCEYCFKLFNYSYVRSFQLHHINHHYDWEHLFDPDQVILIHKQCHKQIHNIRR